jgi:hypothetical protein
MRVGITGEAGTRGCRSAVDPASRRPMEEAIETRVHEIADGICRLSPFAARSLPAALPAQLRRPGPRLRAVHHRPGRQDGVLPRARAARRAEEPRSGHTHDHGAEAAQAALTMAVAIAGRCRRVPTGIMARRRTARPTRTAPALSCKTIRSLRGPPRALADGRLGKPPIESYSRPGSGPDASTTSPSASRI